MKNYQELLLKEVKKLDLDYIGLLANNKLYKVSQIAWSGNFESEFEEFCDIYWSDFKEYAEQNNCTIKQFNRTNSFQIDCDNTLNENLAHLMEKNKDKKLIYIVECFEYKYSWNLDQSCKKAMLEIKNNENMFMENIKEFIDNLKTIIEVYKYMEDFKIHQVEYWEDYINDLEWA